MLLVAFLVCGGVALGVSACLSFRTELAGWSLLVFSALWLPANNGQMEGHPVLMLSHDHSVMTADLYGVLGLIVATVTVVRPVDWRGWQRPDRNAAASRLAACVLVFGLGAATAVLTG